MGRRRPPTGPIARAARRSTPGRWARFAPRSISPRAVGEPVALTDGLRAQIDACAQQCARFLEPGAPLDPNLVEDIGARMGRGATCCAGSTPFRGLTPGRPHSEGTEGAPRLGRSAAPVLAGRDLLFTQQSVCLAMMADWQLAGSWGRAIKLDPEGAFTLGEGLFLTQRLQFGPGGISDRLRCPGRCPSPTIGLRMCGGGRPRR